MYVCMYVCMYVYGKRKVLEDLILFFFKAAYKIGTIQSLNLKYLRNKI